LMPIGTGTGAGTCTAEGDNPNGRDAKAVVATGVDFDGVRF
jgi:hypothetical protein